MSKFFIHHPIAASVVSILIMIIGGVSLLTLPVARYPEITPPTIQVTAAYPGASAETIGETVATPIEQEVNGVENMIYMTSTSAADGSMNLDVAFEVGVDLDMANVLVQNRVNTAMAKLPEEVRTQGVTVKKRSPEITFFVTFFSPDGRYDSGFLHNFAKLNVEDEIKRIYGVGDVKTFGSGEYGMRVWLDPTKMKSRGLTTNQVLAAIREQNVQVAAGMIGQPPAPPDQAFQYVVNTKGRFTEPDQFEEIVLVADEEGRKVYLKDVATIELGSVTYDLSAIYNGNPCAAMGIYQLPGANALDVGEAVKTKLAELFVGFSEKYPGLEYEIAYDATSVISASISEVISTLFITLILVIATVYLFLQNFRATIIPAVTIPVALIGTFAVMAALGFSVNQMTLFGLVLAIGIVVDDAIVVVENVTRLIEEEGLTAKDAAVKSMQQVSGPIVATTLVLLAVFVPTVAMGGITGQLFRQFAVTISIATVFSSINALTLSPALAGVLLKASKRPSWGPFKWFNSALDVSTTVLGGVVKRTIRIAVVALVLFVGLVWVAIQGFGALPTGFVPQEDEGYCIVNIQLPEGSSLGRSSEVLLRASKAIEQVEGVRGAVGIGGYSFLDSSAGPNKAGFIVTFTDWGVRNSPELHQASIVRRINGLMAGIQEAMVVSFAPPSLPGVGMAGGFALQLQDRGGVGLDELNRMAQEFITDGNAQDGLERMFSGFRSNTPQIFVDIDREQVRDRNVELGDVFSTLQANLGSAYVNDFLQFGRIYQVRTQALSSYRDDPGDIGRLEVVNRDGRMIPLSTFVDVQETFGPQIVTHFNIYPSAKINGSASPGTTSGQAMQKISEMASDKLSATMGFEWTDLSYQEAKATGGMAVIFLFSVVLVYLVLAFQYESWALPLSVCFAVPGALMGAVAAVMVRSLDNNLYTQVGIVLLIGLSTKTAILIVEYAKVERDAGKSIADAALNATRLRFRAVLMTAFSFILGVIPLLLASGAGAKSQQAIGTTVFGGMLVATVIGVIFVPVLYFIIQKIAEKLGGGPKPAAAESGDTEA